MDQKNLTRITMVHMLGFQIPRHLSILFFFLFLLIFCVTICGNLLIITLVSYGKTLHTPMYIYISQLSASDILLAMTILPSMLHTVMVNGKVISLSACFTQFYFFAISEISECLFLTVMSYDRYLAICEPLHYPVVMRRGVCSIMIIATWILSSLLALLHTLTLSKLHFCGPDVIDNFFCDVDPILELSCSDTTIVHLEVNLSGAIFVVSPFFIIIISYVYIIVTILSIPSITGRQKAFSTCSSHLSIVSIFYGTIVCVYLIPRGQSSNFNKYPSLLYTVLNPMVNPIIYSLRNKELLLTLDILIHNISI